MTIKPSRNPYGYRNLLVYKKADELQTLCVRLTLLFPRSKTAVALADQMNRSARSTKQNITEGWKRNSTNEYYEFLGYAVASNAELEEDSTDIWKGHYPELTGVKGIMGVNGVGVNGVGVMGEGRTMGVNGVGVNGVGVIGEERIMEGRGKSRVESGSGHTNSARVTPIKPFSPINPFDSDFDIEKLSFYPLDTSLPPVVQLKLRAKELNYLLENLQKSLVTKMGENHTLPTAERLRLRQQTEDDFDHWLAEQKKKAKGE